MQHSNVSKKVTKGGNWVVKIYKSKISICSESFFFWQCSCCPCCCCCGPVCTGLERVTAGFDCLSRRYKMINFNAAAAARDLSPQLGLGGSLIKSNSRGTQLNQCNPNRFLPRLDNGKELRRQRFPLSLISGVVLALHLEPLDCLERGGRQHQFLTSNK